MNNPLDFNDRVTVVTGAASGTGLATAQGFAEVCAAVVLADHREDSVKAATDKLVAAGRKALAVRCDVSDEAQGSAMVGRTASVTFEPGACTTRHIHPLGQTLIVTAGAGWAQREDGPIEEIHPGDVVWFPPGVKHWHGATPRTAMTHIAMRRLMARSWSGWRRSATSKTAAELASTKENPMPHVIVKLWPEIPRSRSPGSAMRSPET